MSLNKPNILYLTVILFMIPPIVLSFIILSVKIKISNLQSIINSLGKNIPPCYEYTLSFINEKNQMKDIYHFTFDYNHLNQFA